MLFQSVVSRLRFRGKFAPIGILINYPIDLAILEGLSGALRQSIQRLRLSCGAGLP